MKKMTFKQWLLIVRSVLTSVCLLFKKDFCVRNSTICIVNFSVFREICTILQSTLYFPLILFAVKNVLLKRIMLHALSPWKNILNDIGMNKRISDYKLTWFPFNWNLSDAGKVPHDGILYIFCHIEQK